MFDIFVDFLIFMHFHYIKIHRETKFAKIQIKVCLYTHVYTVKPVYVVTSIKQLPVLKGHLFLVLS
jgi:uncharacterized protein (DUF983 family)